MEEKKINELSEEALDAVTGGAELEYDESTNTYYVYSEKHELVYTSQHRDAAISVMHNLGLREKVAKMKPSEPVMISQPPEP